VWSHVAAYSDRGGFSQRAESTARSSRDLCGADADEYPSPERVAEFVREGVQAFAPRALSPLWMSHSGEYWRVAVMRDEDLEADSICAEISEMRRTISLTDQAY
jgi:hypothetical protein